MTSHNQIAGIVWKITLISAISVLLTFTTAEQTPGFLSIDCGSSTQYKDPVTNLIWKKDTPYMLTGLDGEVPHPPNSSADNYQALRTFKYFPDRRNKYCYDLPVTTNISILIRAMFLHGNSSKLSLPITFDVYMNATLWTSVQYNSSSDLDSPKVLEGIFYSPGPVAYFCLVPHQGVPFISSLELRQLDPEGVMYFSNQHKDLFLSNLCRYNVGDEDYSRKVRYPDDAYDRLWTSWGWGSSPVDQSSKEVYGNTSAAWNNVPPKVMMTAIVSMSYYATLPLDMMTTSRGYLYAVFYCESLHSSNAIPMQIQLNHATKNFNVSNVPVLKVFDHFSTWTNEVELIVSLDSSSTSSTLSTLNALEIYEEIVVDPRTANNDGHFLVDLKTSFNLTDWQGDPCFPVVDDWIDCSYIGQDMWFADSLFLSKVNNTANLRELQLYSGSSLWELSITYSDVDDATFQFLLQNFSSYELINLTSNKISTVPTNPSLWRNGYLSSSIDLSLNLLTGEMPTFGDFEAQAT